MIDQLFYLMVAALAWMLALLAVAGLMEIVFQTDWGKVSRGLAGIIDRVCGVAGLEPADARRAMVPGSPRHMAARLEADVPQSAHGRIQPRTCRGVGAAHVEGR